MLKICLWMLATRTTTPTMILQLWRSPKYNDSIFGVLCMLRTKIYALLSESKVSFSALQSYWVWKFLRLWCLLWFYVDNLFRCCCVYVVQPSNENQNTVFWRISGENCRHQWAHSATVTYTANPLCCANAILFGSWFPVLCIKIHFLESRNLYEDSKWTNQTNITRHRKCFIFTATLLIEPSHFHAANGKIKWIKYKKYALLLCLKAPNQNATIKWTNIECNAIVCVFAIASIQFSSVASATSTQLWIIYFGFPYFFCSFHRNSLFNEKLLYVFVNFIVTNGTFYMVADGQRRTRNYVHSTHWTKEQKKK